MTWKVLAPEEKTCDHSLSVMLLFLRLVSRRCQEPGLREACEDSREAIAQDRSYRLSVKRRVVNMHLEKSPDTGNGYAQDFERSSSCLRPQNYSWKESFRDLNFAQEYSYQEYSSQKIRIRILNSKCIFCSSIFDFR